MFDLIYDCFLCVDFVRSLVLWLVGWCCCSVNCGVGYELLWWCLVMKYSGCCLFLV